MLDLTLLRFYDRIRSALAELPDGCEVEVSGRISLEDSGSSVVAFIIPSVEIFGSISDGDANTIAFEIEDAICESMPKIFWATSGRVAEVRACLTGEDSYLLPERLVSKLFPALEDQALVA